MDHRTHADMPRAVRGTTAQNEQDAVLPGVGAQARPDIGGASAQEGEGGVSPAVEWFEERAAVIEYEAGRSRIHAESMALREVVEHLGKEAGREAYDHMHARRAAQ